MSNKLPTLAELYSGNLDEAAKLEGLTMLLNQNPNPEWIKIHPFKKNRYLPIDKVEYLLTRIFKEVKIEITGQGAAANGVWVTVRIHYKNPVTGDWMFHDGIGAEDLQVNKGANPTDMSQLKGDAITLAFPIAKTNAVKDASHHIGRIFGGDIGRSDVIEHRQDNTLLPNRGYINEKTDAIKTAATVAEIGTILGKCNKEYLPVLIPIATQRKIEILAEKP